MPTKRNNPMMPPPQQILHRVAQEDTPSTVMVPDNWRGIVIWAIGRFGLGLVMAGAFAFATWKVYEHDTALVERLMRAFEDRSVVDSQLARALSDHAVSISMLRDEIKQAHDRALGQNGTNRK